MDHGNAVRILAALAQGTDPASGRPLGADTVWQQADVVRALFHALSHLGLPPRVATPDAATDRTSRPITAAPAPTGRPSSGNAGRPWSAAETDQAVAAFDAGRSVDAIAATLGRSPLAVEIRLARLDRLPMPTRTRYGPPKTAPATPAPAALAAAAPAPAAPVAAGADTPAASPRTADTRPRRSHKVEQSIPGYRMRHPRPGRADIAPVQRS
jgi:hypothetical protein